VNMSAWSSLETLRDFVYKTEHRPVMARRRQWFERPEGAYQALWWAPAGYWPSPEEGLARLSHLDRFGPGPLAFTFNKHFPPPARILPDEAPEAACA
jgi:hypothetical protein